MLDRWLPDGELRRRAGPQVVVTAIAAHVGLTTAVRALPAGCEAFFEKPCDPNLVVERAKQLLAARAPSTSVRRKRLRDS